MNIQPKIFTLDQANALIPELGSRLARLIRQREQYLLRHDTLLMEELISSAEARSGYGSFPVSSADEESRCLEEGLEEIRREIDKIGELGCILRDLESGSVDFLGRRDGKLVFFCWRQGEERISHYRGIHDSVSNQALLA